MNAGKSTILLQSSYNYHERGMRTLLIKPAIDTRENVQDQITSRIGLIAKADIISPEQNLETHIQKAHEAESLNCVLVDEAQFLTKDQVWQLSKVADNMRLPIMCGSKSWSDTAYLHWKMVQTQKPYDNMQHAMDLDSFMKNTRIYIF